MRTRTRHRDINMTEGPILRHLVYFSLPLLLGNLFQQLYNTVDSVVVGNFVSMQALAAVGSTGSIVNMVVGAMSGLSVGATVVIAQFYGARNYKMLHDAVHTTMLMTLITGVAFIAVGILLVDPMLRFMDTPQDVFSDARTYLVIYFTGLPGLLIYNMTSGILRAVGDSKRPLYFLCFSTVFNIIFDLLFVLGFGMGVEGVAYATVLAEYLSAALTWYVLAHSNTPYQLHTRNLKLDMPILKKIFGIGLPTALQQALTCFSNVYVQSYINAFGSSCMAGWSACSKLDQFVNLPVNSLSMATTTFIGQNLGAQKTERARAGVRVSIWLSLGVTAVLIVLLNLFARAMLSMFSQESDVLDYGIRFVRILSPFYCVMCIYCVQSGVLRGAGLTRIPVAIMLFSFVAFRQVYLLIISQVHNSVDLVAFGYPAGWVVCTVLMAIYYSKSKWTTRPSLLSSEG